jgi:hypothetical protein
MRTHMVLVAGLTTTVLASLLGCPTTPPGTGNVDVRDAGTDNTDAGAGDAGVRDGGVDTDAGVMPTDGGVLEPDAGPAPFATSSKNQLAWKRHIALENDVMQALSLPANELCNELGLYSCVREVHSIPLGGNDPFVKSQYEPLPAPGITTPVAIDRVVLSACTRRAQLDAAGAPVVFGALNFAGADVGDEAARTTLATLATRFLRRPLREDETARLLLLRVDDAGAVVSPADFAKLSCYAVGTLTENFFY